MAKRKKLEIPPSVIKALIIGLLFFGLGLGVYRAVVNLLTQSSFFKIKEVRIDSSLQFIDKRDLVRLTGRNIFTVDLGEVQKQIASKYPQMTQIKIVRRYPDQIQVVAKKRVAMAQTVLKNKLVTLDDKGYVLGVGGVADKNLTFIEGVDYQKPVAPGWPVISKQLQTGLKIIASFENHQTLRKFHILKMNVQSLSKIEFYLTEDFSIIIDQERFDEKMDLLALLFAQGQIDFKQVKYIDLRFNEPIIGKKNVPQGKI